MILMKEKVLHSLYTSLEWRFFAFVITNLFLWVTTGSFWTATGLALLLQIILFISYTFWYLWRCELHLPLFPQVFSQKKERPRVH